MVWNVWYPRIRRLRWENSNFRGFKFDSSDGFNLKVQSSDLRPSWSRDILDHSYINLLTTTISWFRYLWFSFWTDFLRLPLKFLYVLGSLNLFGRDDVSFVTHHESINELTPLLLITSLEVWTLALFVACRGQIKLHVVRGLSLKNPATIFVREVGQADQVVCKEIRSIKNRPPCATHAPGSHTDPMVMVLSSQISPQPRWV